MKYLHTFLITLLTVVFCFSGCLPKKDNSKFIISERTNLETLGHKSWIYYSSFNFLIDTSGELFVHNKDSISTLDTGTDFYYPHWLDLKISDVRKVNIDTFNLIIEKEFNLPSTIKNRIQIAEITDFLNLSAIDKLIDIMKKKKFKNYVIRLTTDEEKEVLTAKIENKDYNFYKTKWKSRFACECFPPPSIDQK